MSNTPNLTKKQKEAMKHVVRLADISIMRLDGNNVGISIKTTDAAKVGTVGSALANLLTDLHKCHDELGHDTSMIEFKQWQAAKRKK